MNCVNIKHPDFQKLLKESNIPSFELEIKVADWQEKNGLDKFPSVSDLIGVKPGVAELFESNFLIFAESKTSDEVISKLLSNKIIDKKCN